MMEKAFEIMPKRRVYENTGIQFMQLNSLYQVLAMRLANSDVLAKTDRLLFMADLISYFLCGKAFGEYTLASTSQMMDMKTGRWSKPIFDELALPMKIMPKITMPGAVVASLTNGVAKEIGCGKIPVIAVGSHDTASAVLGVPASGDKWAYLSSGTWSLMGVELPSAIVNDKTFQYEFTNEGGVEHTIRLLKNIMGLWLVQECKRQWQREGQDLSYGELTQMAAKAKPFFAYVNCDNSDFLAPGDMPARINKCLSDTGQKPTQDKGQMVRLVLESLALKYRSVLNAIEDVTGSTIEVLHLVGGGIQNELLCQFTADATGRKVITGPIEATASGNILMQAKAAGQLKSIAEARQVVRNSFELKEYQPQNTTLWEKQYSKQHK
jgi:rhamnulokinase